MYRTTTSIGLVSADRCSRVLLSKVLRCVEPFLHTAVAPAQKIFVIMVRRSPPNGHDPVSQCLQISVFAVKVQGDRQGGAICMVGGEMMKKHHMPLSVVVGSSLPAYHNFRVSPAACRTKNT